LMKGFQELVTRVYPNLRMLRGVAYAETDIGTYLRPADQGALDDALTPMSEAETESLSFLQANSRSGVRTTIKSLLDQFTRKPYGWHHAAVLCILAKLCARGKVEIRKDGGILDDADQESALRNSHAHGNLMLEPRAEFTASQIKKLKTLHEELFDKPGASGEAKKLAVETAGALREMAHELDKLLAQAGEFPFLRLLQEPLQTIKNSLDKQYPWYVTEFVRQEAGLLQMRENLLDPVRAFMAGPQKDIYREAGAFLKEQEPNFTYMEDDPARRIAAVLDAPDCFKGGGMQRLKADVDVLRKKLAAKVAEERDTAQKALAGLRARIAGMPEYTLLSAEQQALVEAEFAALSASFAGQRLIPVLRDSLRRFEDVEYPRIIAQIGVWAHPGAAPRPGEPGKPEIIPIRAAKVSFNKPLLADEADVDSYLKSMREALLKEIRQGKRIQV